MIPKEDTVRDQFMYILAVPLAHTRPVAIYFAPYSSENQNREGGVSDIDANGATKSVYNTDAGVARQFQEADTTSSVCRVWV